MTATHAMQTRTTLGRGRTATRMTARVTCPLCAMRRTQRSSVASSRRGVHAAAATRGLDHDAMIALADTTRATAAGVACLATKATAWDTVPHCARSKATAPGTRIKYREMLSSAAPANVSTSGRRRTAACALRGMTAARTAGTAQRATLAIQTAMPCAQSKATAAITHQLSLVLSTQLATARAATSGRVKHARCARQA